MKKYTTHTMNMAEMCMGTMDMMWYADFFVDAFHRHMRGLIQKGI